MEQFVKTYGEYIYHLAYFYVKDLQRAEEIAQDVFYQFAKKKEQFRGEASVKTYLTRMAINRSYDELRKMKRQELLQSVLPFMKAEKSAEQEVVKKESSSTVKEAVFTLPVHYREVIILYYYEDFSVLEIAELLKVSVNTVRTRLRRARENLKIELGELLEGGALG